MIEHAEPNIQLIGGYLDGAQISLSEDFDGRQYALSDDDELWKIVSRHDDGERLRFLVGNYNSTHWLIYEYHRDVSDSSRYNYAGVFMTSNGVATTLDVIERVKKANG